MEILYDKFYRDFGIRKPEDLVAPRLPILSRLQLPKNSLLHYKSDSESVVGPEPTNALFAGNRKPIQIHHVQQLKDPKGNPRTVTITLEAILRTYQLTNRRFRQFNELARVIRDESALLVYNYSLVNRRYRYTRSLYSGYNQWWDTEATIWSTVNEIAQQTNRHQFVVIKAPQVLPSVAMLRSASQTAMNQKTAEDFDTPERRFLLEIWKWLGENPSSSMISRLEERYYDNVNLIVEDTGRWFVINLGKLWDWRNLTKEELLAKEAKAQQALLLGESLMPSRPKPSRTFDHPTLQKYLLTTFMRLSETRTDTGLDVHLDEEIPEPEVIDEDADALADAAGDQDDQRDHTLPPVGEDIPVKTAINYDTDIEHPSNQTTTELVLDLPEDDLNDKFEITEKINQSIDDDLAELDRINERYTEDTKAGTPHAANIAPLIEPDLQDYQDKTTALCDRLGDAGALSAAEYRRLKQLTGKYKELINPFGSGTLADFSVITAEELQIDEKKTILPDIHTVIDKSMLTSSLLDFDRRYIETYMKKDIVSMVLNIQNAGIIIDDFRVDKIESILGNYYSYAIRIIPIQGSPSTLYFKVPEIDPDGTYTSNGVKYFMRKQRGPLPIQKVSPDKVGLTSYYGKFFVTRGRKQANNYGAWLRNKVLELNLDQTQSVVTNAKTGNVFVKEMKAPRSFTSLAMNIREFTLTLKDGKSFRYLLDPRLRNTLLKADQVKRLSKRGLMIAGVGVGGSLLLVDRSDAYYEQTTETTTELGTIEELLGINGQRPPTEYAEIKIGGRNVPVGFILAYELGLTNFIERLGVTVNRVPAGTRAQAQIDDISIVFKDETIIFNRSNTLAMFLLGGFVEFKNVLREYSVHEFDRKGIYFNVLEATGGGARLLREIDLLYQLFVDPITKDILIERNEPTTVRGILVHAAQLLLDDNHVDQLDMTGMRIKGYERISGVVYNEMVKSIRAHNARPGKNRIPIDFNPYAVWTTLAKDPAIVVAKEINPIEDLKQQEAVTFGGHGGRSEQTMTEVTRQYHPNDTGIISEATTDSGSVGVNTSLSGNPQLKSLRGTVHTDFNVKTDGITSVLSTSALASPGIDRDDMKRINFTSIQHSHGVACVGYTQNIVRTGYEQVIPHRVSALYANTAKQAGQVIARTDDGVIVQFEDGTQSGYSIGRAYGENAGMTIPHTLVSPLKVGDKLAVGDVITYNKGYFQPDAINPKQVVWMNGGYTKVALLETAEVFEDASEISADLAKLMMTDVTRTRTVVLNFDQGISKLVKVGSTVDADDILCVIEDSITTGSDIFDDHDLDLLKTLGSQAPRAKYAGQVERIEVFYHGDIEDMSESLVGIVQQSDRALAARLTAMGKKPLTGSVDEGFRIKGDPLSLNTLAVKISITGPEAAGVGDKIVFMHQLKSVISRVFPKSIRTEHGEKVDAVFSYTSVANRIVNSPEEVGTTTSLMKGFAKLIVARARS